MAISRWILLRTRNVSDKIVKNIRTHTFYGQQFVVFFPPKIVFIYETMWKNIVESDRPQMKIRRMRFACCVSQSTNSHSGCAIRTYCFSTTTMVTLTRLIVTLYVQCLSWCFSDRTSWIDYILITNLMHWLLFIHKILFSTCFEPQVLIFRRIQLYTCSMWYCHSVNRWVVEYY